MTGPNPDPNSADQADGAGGAAHPPGGAGQQNQADALVGDANPDPRNGAVGGTDGVTKNQDETAQ